MRALRENSFLAGVLLYGLLLAVFSGNFLFALSFAVLPSLLIYLVGNLSFGQSEEGKELTYEDILLFKSKQELLDFLNNKQPQAKSLEQIDKTKTLAVFSLAVFFAGVFAFAFSPLTLASLIALPLMVRKK